MAQRPKNRRLDQVADSQHVRRSPRLSGRFSVPRDDERHPLSSQYSSVSSRPSLRGYGAGVRRRDHEATLFRQEADPGFSRKGTRLGSREPQKTLHEHEPQHQTNILNESGQSVPASFDHEGRLASENVPSHLYGLDESDGESSASSVPDNAEGADQYKTPVRPSYQSSRSKGCLSQVVSFVSSLLYKLGSLIYLAATGILCLDVFILHKVFNCGKPGHKSCGYYLFLPLMLAVVVFFLIGGGLFQSSPPLNGTLTVDYDAVRRHVTSDVREQLNTFKTSFQANVENYVDSAIQASGSKAKLSLETELSQRDQALIDLRTELINEFNSQLTQRIAVLEEQLKLLREFAEGSQGATPEEFNAAKLLFLDEAKQQMEAKLSESLGTLRVELIGLLNSTEDRLDQQFATLSETTTSLRTVLQDTQNTLTGTSKEVNSMKARLDNHDSQLGDLQKKQKNILDEIAQFKADAVARIVTLETNSENYINAEQAISIFHEELDKVVANEKSALRLWLAGNVPSATALEELRKLIKSIQEDTPPGGLSRRDVEEVVHMSLERYSADRIGKFDFALENAGGSVILNKCSPTFPQPCATLFGIPLWRVSGTAKLIIQPQVYPGDCWALNGTSGYATIKLKDEILVTEVSVDHTQLSPNGTIDSAPKGFAVYGLSSVEDDEGTLLGRYSYDIEGPAVQQFDVKGSTTSYGIVRFNFESNYGNPAYTCIYRVRVHGHYPS